MAKSIRFKLPIPKGMRIYEQEISVAGIKHRFEYSVVFARRRNQSLRLEREQTNKHDPNAIKIIGMSKGWFLEGDAFLGYVPAGISEQIVESGMENKVQARLREIFIGDKDYIAITFDILGPEETKEQYDGFIKNKPASQWQKEFFKYFGIKISKSLTTGQAEQIIKERRKIYEIEDKEILNEWDAYEELFDEFEDTDFRETYEIKKVSLSLLRDAITQLINEGETIRALADDIDKVVDKVIKIKPEIERK